MDFRAKRGDGPMQWARFPLTGYDGGLAAEVEWGRCPLCGAVLDSAEDAVWLYRQRGGGQGPQPRGLLPQAWPPQAAGCSSCLVRVPAEEWARQSPACRG